MNKVFLMALARTLSGFFPIYWKFLRDIPALPVIGHCIWWSFLLLLVIILLTQQWQRFRATTLTQKMHRIMSV
jgi:chloramphenicol-sensitive protein RarD